MNYPKVRFVHDIHLEAQYLCFLAKSIFDNNYRQGNIPVLPFSHNQAVYFPDLKYSGTFWREIASCHNRSLDKPFPRKCIDEVISKLPKITPTLVARWSDIESRFFETFIDFSDHKRILSQVTSIEVLVSSYGTTGSFYSRKSGGKIKIFATYRTDLPVNSLVKTLLLAFYKVQVHNRAETGSPDWIDRQATVNYLLTHTRFASIYPDYHVYQPSIVLLKQSSDYLASLGLPQGSGVVGTKNIHLTIQEEKVLSLLTNHKSKVTTFDEIAEILWGSDNNSKYSLAAIAQVISTIRRKYRSAGNNQSLIITKRGRGYLYL